MSEQPIMLLHRALGKFYYHTQDLIDLAKKNPDLIPFVAEALESGDRLLRALLKTFQPKETPSEDSRT